jgi:hypothetical protein
MSDDDAVITAREILADSVCECGDLCSDHAGAPDLTPRDQRECCADGCDCQEFRAVRFTVERAQ